MGPGKKAQAARPGAVACRSRTDFGNVTSLVLFRRGVASRLNRRSTTARRNPPSASLRGRSPQSFRSVAVPKECGRLARWTESAASSARLGGVAHLAALTAHAYEQPSLNRRGDRTGLTPFPSIVPNSLARLAATSVSVRRTSRATGSRNIDRQGPCAGSGQRHLARAGRRKRRWWAARGSSEHHVGINNRVRMDILTTLRSLPANNTSTIGVAMT